MPEFTCVSRQALVRRLSQHIVERVSGIARTSFALEQSHRIFGEARTWWLEFREMILKATVYNLRRSVRYP